jgi:hypothetical protein
VEAKRLIGELAANKSFLTKHWFHAKAQSLVGRRKETLPGAFAYLAPLREKKTLL